MRTWWAHYQRGPSMVWTLAQQGRDLTIKVGVRLWSREEALAIGGSKTADYRPTNRALMPRVTRRSDRNWVVVTVSTEFGRRHAAFPCQVSSDACRC